MADADHGDELRDLPLEALDFPLPEELIARHPAERRADSRLLVVHGAGPAASAAARLEHRRFSDFAEFLRPGDLLVLNDTRVVPARLDLRKETGGVVEGLWLEAQGRDAVAFLSNPRLRPGLLLRAAGEAAPSLRLGERLGGGRWRLALLPEADAADWAEWLGRHGRVPLPPYVRRLRERCGEPDETPEDRERYQTVWAERPGSVAAPTAALHFDAAALERLEASGVEVGRLTLHVGAGTFLPVEAPSLLAHPMHEERFHVGPDLEAALARRAERGGRVVAVGTTVCRALEAWARGERGSTRLLIAPGFRFRVVDALLTNFHTPRSTLLALVAAFAEHLGAEDGLAFVEAVYAEAVARGYRFFSYGDVGYWLPSSTSA